MENKEYIHLYELELDFVDNKGYWPVNLKHTKLEVERKTTTVYYFAEGGKVSKRLLNRVQAPNFTRVYMLHPDNEKARGLFIKCMNELIKEKQEEIAVFKQVKQVVAAFKD